MAFCGLRCAVDRRSSYFRDAGYLSVCPRVLKRGAGNRWAENR
jgi:hypothetical protein